MDPHHDEPDPGPADAGPGGSDAAAPVDRPDSTDPDVVAAAEAGPDDAATADDGTEPGDFTPEQIDALVAERDRFLDAYQRSAADFDNFRKVSHKRLTDEVTRTLGSFVERMLPVLDAVEAAQVHAEVTGGAEGVNALASSLFGFLEKEGLGRLAPLGEAFDPNTADAVVHEPGDSDEPVVAEVLRTGYAWQGRVIRPAMVKVSG